MSGLDVDAEQYAASRLATIAQDEAGASDYMKRMAPEERLEAERMLAEMRGEVHSVAAGLHGMEVQAIDDRLELLRRAKKAHAPKPLPQEIEDIFRN